MTVECECVAGAFREVFGRFRGCMNRSDENGRVPQNRRDTTGDSQTRTGSAIG